MVRSQSRKSRFFLLPIRCPPPDHVASVGMGQCLAPILKPERLTFIGVQAEAAPSSQPLRAAVASTSLRL